MECNIIKDLIPLYIDSCCSKESAQKIEEHIKICDSCKRLYDEMSAPFEDSTPAEAPKVMSKLNENKASVLQSLLLFFSFALLTLGVTLENKTPFGLNNGYWAITLIIPSTALLLSLANWYFVRSYKSRRNFSTSCLLATLVIASGAYIWAFLHYSFAFSTFIDVFSFFGIGVAIILVFCILSKLLSNRFAKMLGKE
ncbi:MAG: zf-HC2 domain-containing protein [Ruminococcus sp.]|nr:zf-HC2 domain-containing protein [Ruminococcus sp.]